MGSDLNIALKDVLQALSDLSSNKFYNATVITDVLKGTESKTIAADKLSMIEGYGKLSGLDRNDISYLIEWLIQKRMILRTKGKYPVLHPTYNGIHYDETMSIQKLYALKKELERDRLDFN